MDARIATVGFGNCVPWRGEDVIAVGVAVEAVSVAKKEVYR